jgi:hypothetical protein
MSTIQNLTEPHLAQATVHQKLAEPLDGIATAGAANEGDREGVLG